MFPAEAPRSPAEAGSRCCARGSRFIRDSSSWATFPPKRDHDVLGTFGTQIKFIKDGEAKEFTIALASMFCKYLRELGMKMFNNFWQEHSPHLLPTAGYYKDSQRFIREIMPFTTKLGLPPENFIRLRS